MTKQERIQAIKSILIKLFQKKEYKHPDHLEMTIILRTPIIDDIATAIEEAIGVDTRYILESMGLTYTYKKHEKKVLDSELMIDISKAISTNKEVITIK